MFILDCSVATAWALTDEKSNWTAVAFAHAEKERAVVPYIFWYEVRNTMVINEWRGRITRHDVMMFLTDLQYLIKYDDAPNEDRLFALSHQYRLSVYDAAYLEVAQRMNLPLCSLDKKLMDAANASGVALWNDV